MVGAIVHRFPDNQGPFSPFLPGRANSAVPRLREFEGADDVDLQEAHHLHHDRAVLDEVRVVGNRDDHDRHSDSHFGIRR